MSESDANKTFLVEPRGVRSHFIVQNDRPDAPDAILPEGEIDIPWFIKKQ
jgi:hypothetical protein